MLSSQTQYSISGCEVWCTLACLPLRSLAPCCLGLFFAVHWLWKVLQDLHAFSCNAPTASLVQLQCLFLLSLARLIAPESK